VTIVYLDHWVSSYTMDKKKSFMLLVYLSWI